MGFGLDKEQEFLEYFKDKFDSNLTDWAEKEKTIDQQELIGRANEEMREFLSHYGIEAVDVFSDNVHILDRSKFPAEELQKVLKKLGTENGFYSAYRQGIAILKDYDVSKLSFFQTLAHEMLHLQGFYSYQRSSQDAADFTLGNGEEIESLNIRRSGFSVGTKDGKKLLFHKLNESIITELEIRFEKAYMVKWPELGVELKARDKYVEQIAERDHVPVEKVRQTVAGIKGDDASGDKWVSYGYHDERQRFNSLVDELFEKNKSDFESREAVFRLFAEATMTGRLLPVARLIEKTFGKGSFRLLGEASVDKSIKDASV